MQRDGLVDQLAGSPKRGEVSPITLIDGVASAFFDVRQDGVSRGERYPAGPFGVSLALLATANGWLATSTSQFRFPHAVEGAGSGSGKPPVWRRHSHGDVGLAISSW